VIGALVNAWAADLPSGVDASGLLQDTVRQLRAEDLEWVPASVDLREQSLTAGGTADPAGALYKLLPEVLARRITQLPPYVFEGVRLAFLQAPPTQRGAAELVSWPPREFTNARSGRTWHFSFYLRVSLQTVPFDPRPRIHLYTGVRRWESHRKVFIPQGDSASVYLAADAPWLADAPIPPRLRFGLGKLAWQSGLGRVGWVTGGPEHMLRRLTVSKAFPDPEILVKDPTPWLAGPDGVTAAVLYSTAMKVHGVGAGHMPRDRAPLTEWAAQALAPDFVPAPDLSRSALPTRPANAAAGRARKTDPTEADLAAEQAAISEAASRRRAHLARALGEPHLIVDVMHQTDLIRDKIVEAAVDDLGLHSAPVEIDAGDESEARTWRTDELEVQLRLHPLGELGSRLLFDGKTPATGDQRDAAIADRRLTVTKHMGRFGAGARLAVTEIGRPEDFAGSAADPKIALRLGFADTQLVSQFIHPAIESGDAASINADAAHRALAAWQDGLRQTGLSTLPAHSLGNRIPDDLQYAAVWMVRKNRSGPTRHAHFLPVAVLMRPESPSILGLIPGLTTWIPYTELLLRIGQDGTSGQSSTWDTRQAETARFLRHALQTLRHRPTLLLSHAQNSRSCWPWLKNSETVPDLMGLGGIAKRAEIIGPGLRHVRVRDADSFETPQWFAPNEATGNHGLAEGLWVPPDAGARPRVFGSTTAKPDTAKHAAVSASKLVPRPGPKIDTGQNAWNPALLEIAVLACQKDDDPETWAALTHQLRITPDNRNALALPLPLHLASLVAEYVLHTKSPSFAAAMTAGGEFT
jgi:pPIWI_RE module N-terminal domain/RNaseH domain of pPIWI_RE/MID domain of pPIWI_RE